jgi:O-acetyl-ADP-ribose deacetylase (regulator of RNase III)
MDVFLRHGDIAEAEADVAVVSANSGLDLEGGAARALRDVCGPHVEIELAAARTARTVAVGDIVATSGGSHPSIKAILWAVIRPHNPAVGNDDLAAVTAAADTIWLHLAALRRRRPLRVVLVNLGAVELGASRSTSVLLQTLAAHGSLHARLSSVTITTTQPADLGAMLVQARRHFPAVAIAGDEFMEETQVEAVSLPALPAARR